MKQWSGSPKSKLFLSRDFQAGVLFLIQENFKNDFLVLDMHHKFTSGPKSYFESGPTVHIRTILVHFQIVQMCSFRLKDF